MKAFVPMEQEDGRFVVCLVENPSGRVKSVGKPTLSFRKAERVALSMNRRAGIPDEVWWTVAETVKNANV